MSSAPHLAWLMSMFELPLLSAPYLGSHLAGSARGLAHLPPPFCSCCLAVSGVLTITPSPSLPSMRVSSL